MKRLVALVLICLVLASCAAKQETVPSASPVSTPSPAPTPSPTPEEEEQTDLDENDEADYYFDFGQDDMIRLNYDVIWPEDQMNGWMQQEASRVGTLLCLKKGESVITVILEDAPEYAGLDEFTAYGKQMLLYAHPDLEITKETAAEGAQRIEGRLPDGGAVVCEYRVVDGLYATLELAAPVVTADADMAVFSDVFVPKISFVYTQIDALGGCHEEE